MNPYLSYREKKDVAAVAGWDGAAGECVVGGDAEVAAEDDVVAVEGDVAAVGDDVAAVGGDVAAVGGDAAAVGDDVVVEDGAVAGDGAAVGDDAAVVGGVAAGERDVAEDGVAGVAEDDAWVVHAVGGLVGVSSSWFQGEVGYCSYSRSGFVGAGAYYGEKDIHCVSWS